MDEEHRHWLHRTARTCGYNIRRAYARELRKNMRPAECSFWIKLRECEKTGGRSWRRQHIIDRYIVDFAHLGRKLIVELDGGYHDLPNHQAWDHERDEVLQDLGWTVIHFKNEQILDASEHDLNNILISIGLC